MTRYEQWDIVSGVGITALAVAAARSIESHRADRLIDDPYAEAFVVAARPPVPMPTRPVRDAPGDGDPDVTDNGNPDHARLWTRVADHMGVRSRFFDDYFDRAGRDGIRQVVILAAGLDTRAFRLDWPPGTRVFELDQPRVLEFKDTVLNASGARPRCERRTVPADLREDWLTPLRAAGFAPDAPTAWLAEGLMPYLPAEAQRDLMRAIANASAPGSRLAVEYLRNMRAVFDDPAMRELSRRFGIDMAALIPASAPEQPTPDRWLDGRWRVARSDPADTVARNYGRGFVPFSAGMRAEDYRFLTAHTPADGAN